MHESVHESCAPLFASAAAMCVRGTYEVAALRSAARARYIRLLLCVPAPTDHALTTQEKRQSSAEAVAGRQAAMLSQIEELEAADAKRREVEAMMAQACILTVVILAQS